MRIVERYGREVLRAEVADVHKENLGWDLEFRLPTGEVHLIEVKGTAGDRSFALTRNERRAASHPATSERYHVYWVANSSQPRRAVIRRFANPAARLTEDVLDPLQWEVWDWSKLAHVEIPVAPRPSK